MEPRTCPWCDSTNTERLGDAGSLLMTEPWYCLDCTSAFEVIRKRGKDRSSHGSEDPDTAGGGDTGT